MPNLGIIASSISGHLIPPSSFESIATVNPTAGSTTVTFSSIPSTYKSLQIRFNYLGTTGAGATLNVNFNSDVAANYSRHRLYGDGTSAAASGNANNSAPWISDIVNGAGTTQPCVGIVDLIDYASTANYKTFRSFSGVDKNSVGSVSLTSGNWRSTSAINRIDITISTDTFAANSTIALYGIK